MLNQLSYLNSRTARACLAGGLCILLLTFYHQSSRFSTPPVSAPPLEPGTALPQNCELNRTQLEEYKLSPTVQYARRYIHVYEQAEAERSSMTDVPERLVAGFEKVDTKRDGQAVINLEKCERNPLQLRVPPIRPKPDASSILFGVSTQAKRLKDSLPQFLHWLGGNHGSMLAVVPADPSTRELQQQMRAAGIDVTIQHSKVGYLEAYFDLVENLYKEAKRRPGTRWVCWMDDDTFFPSMNTLLDRLGNYDATKSHYIGALSEDMHQVRKHGYFGFGGAGVFISMPLLEEMHHAFPDCKKYNRFGWGGDFALYSCMSNYTQTKMAVENDLHQFDFFGDARGVYESGRPLLSLHHWKSWHHFDVSRAVAIADLCGDDCILQRYMFQGDGSTNPMVLSNGFSIVEYPGEKLPEFKRTEQTWNINGDELKSGRDMKDILNDFAHSVGPLRPRLKEGEEKISYDLLDVVKGIGGEYKQVYLNKGQDGKEDKIIELIWVRRTKPAQSKPGP